MPETNVVEIALEYLTDLLMDAGYDQLTAMNVAEEVTQHLTRCLENVETLELEVEEDV